MLKRQDRNKLTAREEQVLKLTINGFTNKEVAAQLNISYRTVKTHVHNIRIKQEAASRIKDWTSVRLKSAE